MITQIDRLPHQPVSPGKREGLNNASDADLIKTVLAGQVEAFPLLMGRYETMVRKMLWPKLRDESRVDGVFQSAVLKCFVKLDRFRFESSFGTWLTQVAIRRKSA